MITKITIISLSYLNALAAFVINFYLMTNMDLSQFGYWSYTNSAAGILAAACMFGFPRYLMSCVSKINHSFNREFTIGMVSSLTFAIVISLYIHTPLPHLLMVLTVSFIINEYAQVVAQSSQKTKAISLALLTSTATRSIIFFVTLICVENSQNVFLILYYSVIIQTILQLLSYICISGMQKKQFCKADIKLFSDYSTKINSMYFVTGLTSTASNHFITFLTSSHSNTLGAEVNIFLLIANMITLLPGSIFTRLIDFQYQTQFEGSQFKLKKVINQTVLLFIAGTLIAVIGLETFFAISSKLSIEVNSLRSANILVLSLFIAVRFCQFPLSAYMNVQSNILYKNITLLSYLCIFALITVFLQELTLSYIVNILLLLEFVKLFTFAARLRYGK